MLHYAISPNSVTYRDLPLNLAIEAGNVALVQTLLEHGADANPKVNFIFFPIATIVRKILKAKPDAVPKPDLQILPYLLDNSTNASKLCLSSGNDISLAKFKTLHNVLRQHGWVPAEARIGHGGPP